MQVTNNQLQSLFRNIPDPKMRKEFNDIISSDVVKEIYCMSKKCKNRLIGYILDNGKVSMVTDKNNESYLRTSRHRLDGFMGFECWCGNDSRLAPQEVGHLGAAPPSKSALEKIWQKVTNTPSDYPITNGEQIIDGFMIKELI